MLIFLFLIEFNSTEPNFDIIELRKQTEWEDVISDEYLHSQEIESKETTEYKMQTTLEK